MREALPAFVLIVVLLINFISSVIDQDRNSKASFIATMIILAITWWGGFFKPLIAFLSAKV
ncbi:MAG: hypothetical protein LLG97_17640 [Deltaproteobacteria bacterium]|nr:hypothetical protein [Deltaproteobacteria bacterium]